MHLSSGRLWNLSSRYLASRWLQRLAVDSLAKTNALIRVTSHLYSFHPKDSAVSTALPDLSKEKRKGITTSLMMIILANVCNCTLLKISEAYEDI